MQSSLTLDDFAALFGISPAELPKQCQDLIKSADFSYKVQSGEDLKRLLLKIIKMNDETRPIVRSERVNNRAWNNVWKKSLADLKSAGHCSDATIPPYFTPPEFIRLKRDYVIANDPNFFLNVYTIYRTWAFLKFLSEHDAVYEFGCGSCNNLSLLSRLFPDKRLIGLDIATPPIEMIRELAITRNWKVEGKHFDMFRPDPSVRIEPTSAVLTVTALEQIGPRHEPFIRFLLQQCPALCVHLEPIAEWYDESQLGDYLTLQYHRKHGYLEGFWPRLKELEGQRRVEILEARRLEFGGYHDACSLIVWRPCREMREQAQTNIAARLSRWIGMSE